MDKNHCEDASLEQAIIVACKYHKAQKDKSGESYITHPIRVMMEFKDEVHRIVAILHDTVEDTLLSIEAVETTFGKEVAEAVDSLTRRTDENYMDFIRRCSLNKIGRAVKLMDIKDNRSPERFREELTGLQGRYVKAQSMLVDALKDGETSDVEFLYNKGFIGYDEFRGLTKDL